MKEDQTVVSPKSGKLAPKVVRASIGGFNLFDAVFFFKKNVVMELKTFYTDDVSIDDMGYIKRPENDLEEDFMDKAYMVQASMITEKGRFYTEQIVTPQLEALWDESMDMIEDMLTVP